MSVSKLPLLLALLGVSTLGVISVAQAQRTQQKLNSVAPTHRTYTTVDANGNVVRATTDASAAATAEMAADNARRQRGRDRDWNRDRDRNRNRNDKVRYGGGYYIPPVPYYPYGAPIYNNYYPALPSTTILGTPAFSWSRPSTITNIPLGNQYGGYPAPNYGYGYAAPTYGYPAYGQPTYGQPGYGYPGVPYPAYGTSTTIYGAGTGSIYSQSQTGGYGVSIGNGGISVQLGNRQSSSSTTVTTR